MQLTSNAPRDPPPLPLEPMTLDVATAKKNCLEICPPPRHFHNLMWYLNDNSVAIVAALEIVRGSLEAKPRRATKHSYYCNAGCM